MALEVNNILIRPAKKEDMVGVFKMIKELAEFENMLDQVKINETTLMKDGFETDSPAFSCFVADDNNNIVGYALSYYCYSAWVGKSVFLEDLYVEDAYRKYGIGRRLFLEVAKLAYETSRQLEFHVLSWNPAMNFYKALGSIDITEMEKWHTFRLSGEQLDNLFK